MALQYLPPRISCSCRVFRSDWHLQAFREFQSARLRCLVLLLISDKTATSEVAAEAGRLAVIGR